MISVLIFFHISKQKLKHNIGFYIDFSCFMSRKKEREMKRKKKEKKKQIKSFISQSAYQLTNTHMRIIH